MNKTLRAAFLVLAVLLIGSGAYELVTKKEAVADAVAISADGTIAVQAPYLRSNGPKAKAGAGFLVITNTSGQADRLVNASSDVAQMVQTHTHTMTDDGVMQMRHAESGFEIPAGGQLVLERGGKHLMLMQLAEPLQIGATWDILLTFERAGPLSVTFPVQE